MNILLNETLIWKIVQFIQETGAADSFQPKSLLLPPNIEPDIPKNANIDLNSNSQVNRRCYFGTLDLEFGNIILSGIYYILFIQSHKNLFIVIIFFIN